LKAFVIAVLVAASFGARAQNPEPSAPPPASREAIVLLDRIQALVDEALAEKNRAVGTTGKTSDKPGKVTIDRAALDEIRAEVSQLKTMLETRTGIDVRLKPDATSVQSWRPPSGGRL
jgi:predicted NBD/HSP70 family sugar kinase